MKFFLILLLFFVLACSSNKEVVDLDLFRKGEKINVNNIDNIFNKEIEAKNTLQLSIPQINKSSDYEFCRSNNLCPHFVYEGLFTDVNEKNIGSYINKNNKNGSIVASNNSIFFSDEKGNIYNYDYVNNKIIWEIKIYDSTYNSIPKNISLLVNNNYLFASDNLGYIYSIDVKNGKVVWQSNYGVSFSSNLNLYKDILYVTNQNGRLYSFNSVDGQKLISFETLSGIINAKKDNISIFNNVLVFSNDVGNVTALDLDKKKVLWSKNIILQNYLNANKVFSISNILIDNSNVYVSSNLGDLYCVQIDTGIVKWSYHFLSSQNHIVNETYLFVLTDNGYVVAFDKNKGNILWSTNINKTPSNIEVSKSFFSISDDKKDINEINFYGLILGSNNLYLTSSDGFLYKISATEGKLILKKKINDQLTRAPIIIDNKLIIINNSASLILIN